MKTQELGAFICAQINNDGTIKLCPTYATEKVTHDGKTARINQHLPVQLF